MSITKASDFTAEPIKIPHAVSQDAGVSGNADLTGVIVENERDLLIKLLGETQYFSLQTELAKLPFTEGASETASTIYVELVNGKANTSWEGLRAILKNYIFCKWLEVDEISNLVTGTGKGETEGFTVADNSAKYVSRWNIFVEKYNQLTEYLGDSADLDQPEKYPYFDFKNSLGI